MKKILFSTLLIALMISCGQEKRKSDISNIDLDIKIQRFDQAFWDLDTSDIKSGFSDLNTKFPDITPIYVENVVRFGPTDSAITLHTYKLFKNDSSVRKLYCDVLHYYKDLSDIEAELTGAFKRAKYFFPQIPTPQLYTHVSGFNQNIVVGDNFLSLSLDNYMGENYPLYEIAGIYNYQRPNMCREKIASDFITAWLSSTFPNEDFTGSNLLSDIIYRGKILYLTSLLLPDEPDYRIMGYTREQWSWAQKWEADMWGTLMLNKDLFATDLITRGRYTNDGPFTKPFTQESPSRAGVYVGWRIVECYMKKNKRISPMQLIQQTDSKLILSQSNYKP